MADAFDTIFHSLLLTVAHANGVEAKNYSPHSFRSYLASAMMAAGCQDSEIQAALRWSSEDALNIYKVPNAGVYGGWLRRAERVKLTGARAISLQRPLPVSDCDGRAALAFTSGAALRHAATLLRPPTQRRFSARRSSRHSRPGAPPCGARVLRGGRPLLNLSAGGAQHPGPRRLDLRRRVLAVPTGGRTPRDATPPACQKVETFYLDPTTEVTL